MKRLLVGVLLLAGPVSVSAELDPQDVQKYRHEVFEGMAKHMKALGLVVKGTANRPKSDAVMHARAVHEAGLLIGSMFPAGTGPDKVKTDALPAVWTDAAGFKAASDAFTVETGKLMASVDAGDLAAAGEQMRAVGKACGGCHDKFRVEE
jgi:cytochrome c556